MLLSCDLCGVKWCGPCHEALWKGDGHTLGDGHRKDMDDAHVFVECLVTGKKACDPQSPQRPMHVTECIHILDAQSREGTSLGIKENV